jgi:hypothetical protein
MQPYHSISIAQACSRRGTGTDQEFGLPGGGVRRGMLGLQPAKRAVTGSKAG